MIVCAQKRGFSAAGGANQPAVGQAGRERQPGGGRGPDHSGPRWGTPATSTRPASRPIRGWNGSCTWQSPSKRPTASSIPDNTVVDVCGRKVGGRDLHRGWRGPCSVESQDQIDAIAQAVAQSGAQLLRGGAFKPRDFPLRLPGTQVPGPGAASGGQTAAPGLPIVTEIMSPDDIEVFVEKADVIQVGARNMQNFDLLQHLGQIKKPVLISGAPPPPSRSG